VHGSCLAVCLPVASGHYAECSAKALRTDARSASMASKEGTACCSDGVHIPTFMETGHNGHEAENMIVAETSLLGVMGPNGDATSVRAEMQETT
jgi:hypothetical protein